MNQIKSFLLLSLLSVCWARNAFPDKTDENFQNDCLQTTNTYRAQHHAPALKVDQTIVEYAKSRCQLISQYEALSHGHAGLASGYGENLYWGGNSAESFNTGAQAVKSWYDEVKQYSFSNPGFSGTTGHFTQLVWKSTTSVGCARCGGRGSQWFETYVVCDYKPAGNVVGGNYFKENVLPK